MMNKLEAYENSYVDFDENNRAILEDLVQIGFQVKNELGLMYSPIQIVSSNRAHIGNIIGNIVLNTTNLIIYPKFVSKDSDEKLDDLIKTLFTRTVKCVNGNLNSTIYFYKNNTIDYKNNFFDVLAKYFLDITSEALKKSKICMYEDCVEKVRAIKGRILVQQQLSSPMMDDKTWCRFRRLSNNNIYNQLLFWACRYLLGLTSNFDIKRKLSALSREFPQSMELLEKRTVSSIKVPRQFVEYEKSIILAKDLYLNDARRTEEIGGGHQISGYVINMERSFENIVCYYSKIAASSLGYRHKSQTIKQLATSSESREYNYDVRPDDLISKGTKSFIIDAKYKLLSTRDAYKKKPSREDFYQMVSSCIAYDCKEAVLIYPYTEAFPKMFWQTDNKIDGSNITVRAVYVDVSVIEECLIQAFIDIMKETNFYREIIHG